MRTLLYRLGGPIAALLLTLASSARADQTNLMSMLYDIKYAEASLTQNHLSEEFIDRLEQELLRNDDAVTSKIGMYSSMKWAQAYQLNGYSMHERINQSGRDAVMRLLGDSVKETALATLPIDEFRERGRLIGNFISSIFVGIVGNTVEERANDTIIESDLGSFNASEKSWWTQLKDKNIRRYGIRPFRANPYIYYSPRIGNWGDNGLPILILDNRISYKIPDGPGVKSSVIMPLTQSLYLSASFNADLFRDSKPATDLHASCRIEHTFGRNKHVKSLYAGIKADEKQTFAFVGFFTPW